VDEQHTNNLDPDAAAAGRMRTGARVEFSSCWLQSKRLRRLHMQVGLVISYLGLLFMKLIKANGSDFDGL
jgi:hypothetical protein